MIIEQQAKRLQTYLEECRRKGLKIGFIPTMGALHNGHISLINEARKQTGITICSIFVNPTQFNDPRDFEKYPATLGADLDLLFSSSVDAVLVPTVKEIYPAGQDKKPYFDLDGLDKTIEGKYRPGHFQGVCQVVYRLLSIVQPNKLFMGQKDYQQCLVIRKLIEIMELPVQLEICPTIRESNGLAMSSRNLRLTPDERSRASLIFNVLNEIKGKIDTGLYSQVKSDAIKRLEDGGFKVDYTEIVNARDLTAVEDGDFETPLVALIAAYMNEVRLIDNMVVRQSE